METARIARRFPVDEPLMPVSVTASIISRLASSTENQRTGHASLGGTDLTIAEMLTRHALKRGDVSKGALADIWEEAIARDVKNGYVDEAAQKEAAAARVKAAFTLELVRV